MAAPQELMQAVFMDRALPLVEVRTILRTALFAAWIEAVLGEAPPEYSR
jgi:hypothetical protein